jgi:transmembrane sensor
MTDFELKALFVKYLDGTISPEELSRLFVLVNESYQTEELDALFEFTFSNAESAVITSESDRKEILAGLLSAISEKERDLDLQPPVRSIVSKNRIYRYVAAACVIVIGTGLYFYINKTKTRQLTSEIADIPKDIGPGGNKATLTLSNGTKIILDSAADGTLAQQNGSKIIKSGTGKLSYANSNEKPSEGSVEISNNTLTTPRGGQYQLILPDGTKVWLNSASSITYPTAFSGKERLVTITGEAYFEVVHNAKRPFRVKSGDRIIEDIGTHFNVNAYADETDLNVTLLEGAVEVQSIKLKPGQQAQINPVGSVKVISNVDLEKTIAWKNGQFEFENLELSAIMRQVSRWYDVDVINKAGDPGLKFGGGISRNLPLQTLLKLLENSGAKFKVENRTITIIK